MLIINKFFIVLAFAGLSCSLSAHDLDGEWIVDQERTIAFNTKNIKFTSVRLALLGCSINNSSLFFSKTNGRFTMRDHDCDHEGRKTLIKGIVDDFTFSILFQSEKQSVIKLKNKIKGTNVEIVNWIDSENFWINQGDDDEISRYFYKKIH